MSGNYNGIMFNKMDPTYKAKWLTALRSGKYKQGIKALRTSSNTYCCLGVLCDVVNPNVWNVHPGAVDADYTYGPTFEAAFLSDEVKAVTSFSSGGQSILTMLNDEGRADFHRIADWIEANL